MLACHMVMVMAMVSSRCCCCCCCYCCCYCDEHADDGSISKPNIGFAVSSIGVSNDEQARRCGEGRPRGAHSTAYCATGSTGAPAIAAQCCVAVQCSTLYRPPPLQMYSRVLVGAPGWGRALQWAASAASLMAKVRACTALTARTACL